MTGHYKVELVCLQRSDMDPSRSATALLIAFTVTKEMNYALHGRVMRNMIPRVELNPTDEFDKDAVRIALTTGLTVAWNPKEALPALPLL